MKYILTKKEFDSELRKSYTEGLADGKRSNEEAINMGYVNAVREIIELLDKAPPTVNEDAVRAFRKCLSVLAFNKTKELSHFKILRETEEIQKRIEELKDG